MTAIAKDTTQAAAPQWGMTPEQIAKHPTVYRDNLLAGKVVLVSGGGSGFGQCIALLCAKLGAQVVICSRDMTKLQSTVDGAREFLGREIIPHVTNIRDPEAVNELMDFIWSRCGGLDVLVNNAGGQYPQAAIDLSVKGWNAVIDLNLNGTWYMMQAAAKRWVAAGKPGNVVNIVAHIERGMPQVAHTCAARAGVIYLSKTVSTEWAEHEIRVNCIAAGSIESSGFAIYPDGVPQHHFRTSNPMLRTGDVYDIAEGVVYLAAETGKFITGAVLTIDGGGAQWGNAWPGGRPERFNV